GRAPGAAPAKLARTGAFSDVGDSSAGPATDSEGQGLSRFSDGTFRRSALAKCGPGSPPLALNLKTPYTSGQQSGRPGGDRHDHQIRPASFALGRVPRRSRGRALRRRQAVSPRSRSVRAARGDAVGGALAESDRAADGAGGLPRARAGKGRGPRA